MSASTKQQLAAALKDERARTTKVLDAYPASASELKPHPTSQAAREIVHTLCVEAVIGTAALDGSLDMTKRMSFPPPPPTWNEVVKAFHGAYDKLFAVLEATPDEELAKSTKFMVGPKQIGDVPKGDLVRFMLNDHIHHRGQLSVYLRMSGSKVPSIYGPSKDEPWS
ncbi:MAG: DinB family protein [Gemmatimonadales bacterium]